MIPLGSVASQAQGSGGAGELTPTVSLDFVNGVYTVNGSSVTAGDVTDSPGDISAGTGLVATNGTTVPELIGDARAPGLTADWTVLVEYEELSGSGDTYPLAIFDSPSYLEMFAIRRSGFVLDMYAEEDTAPRTVFDSGYSVGVGIHKIAVTRTSGKLALSVDGRAVVSNTDEVIVSSWAEIGFGQFPGENVENTTNIRKLEWYEPLDDGNLPILSAA